ncbi:MAG: RBBP9/YdeN family alpha/beta hydrolase [Nocardioides sp.]
MRRQRQRRDERRRTVTRVVLIPGNAGASVDGVWFPSLRRRLIDHGLEVVARDFPDPLMGRSRYWMPFLINEIVPDASTILVGHSSGALAALRYGEIAPLLGTVTIGAHHTDCGYRRERRSGFFDDPWDWAAIRSHQRYVGQIHATDDPWVPFATAKELHELLGSEFIVFDEHGHFGTPAQRDQTFPELVDVICDRVAALADGRIPGKLLDAAD